MVRANKPGDVGEGGRVPLGRDVKAQTRGLDLVGARHLGNVRGVTQDFNLKKEVVEGDLSIGECSYERAKEELAG